MPLSKCFAIKLVFQISAQFGIISRKHRSSAIAESIHFGLVIFEFCICKTSLYRLLNALKSSIGIDETLFFDQILIRPIIQKKDR